MANISVNSTIIGKEMADATFLLSILISLLGIIYQEICKQVLRL